MALRRQGQRREARALLSDAAERARVLGASATAESAEVELAAAGHSNKEIAQALFVTLRTVETHLTEVYRRLAIGSRAELAAALRTSAVAPVPAVVAALEHRGDARSARPARSPDPSSPPLRRPH